mmetsp:Transcript_57203/g.170141  ORF Transcript_57203/g.170141 Transcript_57203/m.170141 type:complete len:249 (+) Transcript_57203:1216-1962(+)
MLVLDLGPRGRDLHQQRLAAIRRRDVHHRIGRDLLDAERAPQPQQVGLRRVELHVERRAARVGAVRGVLLRLGADRLDRDLLLADLLEDVERLHQPPLLLVRLLLALVHLVDVLQVFDRDRELRAEGGDQLLVLPVEAHAAQLVDQLDHADHVVIRVEDRVAHDRLGAVARLEVDLRVEAVVVVRVGDVDQLAGDERGASKALVRRDHDGRRAVGDDREERVGCLVEHEERRAVHLHQLLGVLHHRRK